MHQQRRPAVWLRGVDYRLWAPATASIVVSRGLDQDGRDHRCRVPVGDGGDGVRGPRGLAGQDAGAEDDVTVL